MEGDPESSPNASGGDHPFDCRDSKGGDPAGQIPPKEIKMNFGRGQGIPAKLPLVSESLFRKSFTSRCLRRPFSAKVGLKQGWQCHKAGCQASRAADILIP